MENQIDPADLAVAIPADIRAKYIERRRTDIASLKSALDNHSFEEFKRIGHQLKGNAASFGYLDLEKIAVQLEGAGNMRNVVEAARQLNFLEEWLNQQDAPTAG